MTEDVLLDTLKNWEFYKRRIKELDERAKEITFSTTPSYSSDIKVVSSGLEISKIERFCFAQMPITEERDNLLKRLRASVRAFQKTDLTPLERATIVATVRGESLLEIVRKNNMAQAKIYRIRDRAVKKMVLTLQNELYHR